MVRSSRIRFFLCFFAPAFTAAILVGGDGEKTRAEIVATLKGHSEPVYTVAFSADGKLLATGSFDNTVKLWDVSTGKELRTFGGQAGHQKMVLSVAISPDGQMLASGSVDNTLKIWDVPVNTPLRTVTTTEAQTAIALSPDGTKLAAGGKDGLIRLWSPADGKELAKIDAHTGAVTDLSFSSKGDILASSGADRMVRYWNTSNGQLAGAAGAHDGAVNNVLIHPANNVSISGGEDGTIKVWQFPPAPTRALPAHAGPIAALAVSGDGNTVVTGGDDKIVRQSQTAGKEIRTLAGAQAGITSVSLGNLVVAGSADGKVNLWNANDGKPAGQFLAHGGPLTSISLNPQNNQVMTSAGDGLVKFWTIPVNPQRSIPHPDGVLASALSQDGRRLITGGADKIVRSWDLGKLTVERQFTGHTGPVTAVALSNNGQTLVSGGSDATIRLWEQSKGAEVGLLGGHAGAVTVLAINPGNNQLLSASEDGTLKLWQLPFNAPKTLPHPDQVTSLAVTNDGSRLVTGGSDKQVRVWNLANGNKERDLAGPTLPVTSVGLSGDAKMVAAGSTDKTIHVWSLADGKALAKLTVPAAVQAVALNGDGKLLAAGLADNSIKLLNPLQEPKKDAKDKKKEEKDEGKTLTGHAGPVTGLAFSPKGDLLFSASADKTVQTWSLPEGTAKTKFEFPEPVSTLCLSKDGTRLAAIGAKTVKIWNSGDGKELASFTTPSESKSVGFAPDGTRIVVGSTDKIARVYDLEGKLLESFSHDGPVQAASFIDAKRIATGGTDKLARVWTSSLLWQKSHEGGVSSALFTPKGDQVISGGADKMVRIWNAADGKEVKALAAHEGAVVALSIAGDGTKLASAGADKVAKVWNLTGKEDKALITMPLPSSPTGMTMNNAGTRLAVGTTEEKSASVRIFDVALGKEVQLIPEHSAAIKTLAFLADNRTLLSGSLDKTARLSDVNIAGTLDAHPGGVVSAQYHANGTQILTAGADKTVKLWDLAKSAMLKTIGPLPDAPRSAVFNRDFTQIGVAAGKVVKVWNVADGKELQTLTHPAEVLSLSFSTDKRLVTGSSDKLVRIFDLTTGKELQFFAEPDAVQNVVYHPQNGSVIATTGKEPRVETLTFQRAIAVDSPIRSMALTPNGAQVVTGGTGKDGAPLAAKVWNIQNGQPEKLAYAGGKGAVRTIAVAKNGQIVATGGEDQVVRVFNLGDGKEIGSVKVDAPITALAFAPNSLMLAGLAADKSFVTWNVGFQQNQPLPPEFLKPIQSFNATGELTGLQFAPDNIALYTSGADKTVRFWKLAAPAPTRNFAHPNLVNSVAFHSAGNLIATGCHDGKIRIFELTKNTTVKEITAHVAKDATQIYAVAFSPDGKQIASGSFDGSLKLFDATSGNLIREFKAYKIKEFEKGHQDPVYALAFSPDGRFLASGSGGLERVIKIWNVADGSVVRDLENPNFKTAPMQPVQSHPGWIYKLRFSKNGKLISAGDAPQNKGYLAVWNPQDGKLLYGESLALGTFFGLAVSPDDSLLALGAGPRGAPRPELNSAYLLRIPELK